MAQNFPPSKRTRERPPAQRNRGGNADGNFALTNNMNQNNPPDEIINRLAYLENLVVSAGIVTNNNNQGAIPRNSLPCVNPNRRNRQDNWRQRDNSEQRNVPRRVNENDQQQRRGARERFGSQESVRSSNGNGQYNNRRREAMNKVGVGFKLIESLCEKDPEEIMASIATNDTNFSIRLDQDLSGDYIFIILKLLAKMCGCAFTQCKIEVITVFCKDKFIDQLVKFIATLPLHNQKDKKHNQYFWQNPAEFFNNIHVLCNSLLELMPSMAIDVIPKLISSAVMSIQNIESMHRDVKFTDEIKDKFQKLQEKLDLSIKEIEKKKLEVRKCVDTVELEPPDDFRELSVYPTSIEVLSKERSFMRENRIDRQYKSVDEYLDVQFRLLREDFVGPLREGIGEYRMQREGETTKKKIHSVKVHPRVQFVGAHNVKDQVGYKVQFEFNLKKLSKVFSRLENSKRFMYGSLVCFTRDNFVSLHFGKIIDRDVKLLEKGLIVVNFDQDDVVEYGVDYLMVECSVYFEPYYHVLKALQTIDVDRFPMERYIIHVDREIKAPSYLALNSTYVIDRYNVELFNDCYWPSAKSLSLNETQYNAFKAGLTNEFCIIQGPPGTGKTYLGLKIAKTLLINKKYWYHNSPILIVCYTNHALDQFLEGLIGTTSNIIRVGGQSKNETLKAYNINEKRKTMLRSGKVFSKLLFEKQTALHAVCHELQEISREVDFVDKFDGVIDFKCFSSVEHELSSSWFATAKNDDIEKWLFGGRTVEEREKETSKARIEALLKQMENNEMDNQYDLEEDDDLLDIAEQQENEQRLDYDDLEIPVGPIQPLKYILKLETIEEELKKKVVERKMLVINVEEDIAKAYELENECFELENKVVFLKSMLNRGKTQIYQKPPETDLVHPHKMPSESRWQLYFYWLHIYRIQLCTRLDYLGERQRILHKQYSEVRNIEDVNLMKQMSVVGMTTTGAARLQTSLQALKCQIVIVEEAAEVLESHIVTSLTSHCAHLILIGDHQQLRPSTANYFVEKEMKLGISLFERMVRNNLHCSVLGVQHRMRPEISRLIRPAIYPHLIDHESVLDFPPVRGIDHNLYFLHHTHEESLFGDSSKENKHEAAFLVRLARHLILNGYEPHEITILAAYLGQFYTIRNEKKKYNYLLRDVRIAVLDNYQGEECKIILLSLVRNNKDKSIGFLKIENRVCVALSRAKEGMYIMGNMDLLVENSEIWKKIKPVLVEQNCLGEHLTLRCQVHQNRVTEVKEESDFSRCPEGGCDEVCGMDLNCGHTCQMMCHIKNRDHQAYRCKQSCKKLLCDDPEHKCKKMCYQECGPCKYIVHRTLRCGHEHNIECHIVPEEYKCPTQVPIKLDCGHETKKPCHMEKIKCPFPCEARLECGHACINLCHIHSDPDHLQYKCRKNCAKLREGCTSKQQDHFCRKLCFEECEPCTMIVRKKRTVCTHLYDVECRSNVDEIVCEKPCKTILPCGHKCKNLCCNPCGNCQFLVDKIVERCGHTVQVKCCETPTRKNCKGKCPALLPCGHQCDRKCFESCTTKCQVLIDSPVQAACGHAVKIPCYLARQGVAADDSELLQYCRNPCNALLACEHPCSGTCGECTQGRVHKTCGSKCGVILVCGHDCPIPCRKACQPCRKPCEYSCVHSKCKKMCGQPCTHCTERCPRACAHTRCSAKCGKTCTVDPCTEPCPKMLPCRHPCVGFCGDPCPPLCRVCNREELEEILFGFEQDEDARYVLLVECGHVIESQGMEMWLKQTREGDDENEIKVKRCPKCNTRLSSTPRYTDYVKAAMKDIINIKSKFYGLQRENEAKREELQRELITQYNNCLHIFPFSAKLQKVLQDFEARLQPTKGDRRQDVHISAAAVITSRLELLKDLIKTFKEYKLNVVENRNRAITLMEFILECIARNEDRLTTQEINDIQCEIMRFNRLLQLLTIKEAPSFAAVYAQNKVVQSKHKSAESLIFYISSFTNQMDRQVKILLTEITKEVKTAMVITETERRQIVSAIGLKAGHWFKCSNGHYYAIGECGGAMEIGKCPECGVLIGGKNHALLPGNQLAREMDGASAPAWPTVLNNFNNYDLRDLN